MPSRPPPVVAARFDSSATDPPSLAHAEILAGGCPAAGRAFPLAAGGDGRAVRRGRQRQIDRRPRHHGWTQRHVPSAEGASFPLETAAVFRPATGGARPGDRSPRPARSQSRRLALLLRVSLARIPARLAPAPSAGHLPGRAGADRPVLLRLLRGPAALPPGRAAIHRPPRTFLPEEARSGRAARRAGGSVAEPEAGSRPRRKPNASAWRTGNWSKGSAMAACWMPPSRRKRSAPTSTAPSWISWRNGPANAGAPATESCQPRRISGKTCSPRPRGRGRASGSKCGS